MFSAQNPSRRALYISVGLHILLLVALIIHLPSMNYRLQGPVVKAHLINMMPATNAAHPDQTAPSQTIPEKQQQQKTQLLKQQQQQQQAVAKAQAVAAEQKQLQQAHQQMVAKMQAQAAAQAKAAVQAKAAAQIKAAAQARAQAQAMAQQKAQAIIKQQAVAQQLKAKTQAIAKAKALTALKQQQALKALAVKQKQLQQQLLQQQLTGEQKQLTSEVSQLKSQQAAAAQAQANQGVIDQYKAQIVQAIEQQWAVPDATDPDLNCLLLVHLAPGGAVLGVQILHSSGNSALDQSAETAVYKASPLPVPKNPAIFDNFRELRLTVSPKKIIQS